MKLNQNLFVMKKIKNFFRFFTVLFYPLREYGVAIVALQQRVHGSSSFATREIKTRACFHAGKKCWMIYVPVLEQRTGNRIIITPTVDPSAQKRWMPAPAAQATELALQSARQSGKNKCYKIELIAA